jgi:hypothetical protein
MKNHSMNSFGAQTDQHFLLSCFEPFTCNHGSGSDAMMQRIQEIHWYQLGMGEK